MVTKQSTKWQYRGGGSINPGGSYWIAYILPALLIYLLFMAYPLVDSVRLSLYTGTTGARTFIGLDNYIKLFTDPVVSERFWGAFRNTWVFFSFHMLVQNVLGILFAVLLTNRTMKFVTFYQSVIFLPCTIAVLVTGYLFKLMLNPIWAGPTLKALGLGFMVKPWLGETSTALNVISLVSCWQWVGIPTMMFVAGFQGISDDLIEASLIEGANNWHQFWRIKLPLIMPVVGMIAILTFVSNFNAFDVIYAMATPNGAPDYSTDLIGTLFYRYGVAGQHPVGIPEPGLGAAISTTVFTMLLAGVIPTLRATQTKGENSMVAKGKRSSSIRIANMHIPSHVLLILWSLVALFPIWILLINSFKIKADIYKNPFWLPKTWTIDNYMTVFGDGNFFNYFRNSLMVVVVSLGLILLLGSLAAYALAHWRGKMSRFIFYVIIVGMMLPIKIATIRLLEMMKGFGLLNSLWSLFPVYIAMGIPTSVFILTEFIRGLPGELYEAGYVDGATRFKIYWKIVIPLIRPALATVAIYNLVPIWNDLWFPLIFINQESQKTILLAVTKLQGQYTTDWPKVLAVLTLSALPVILLYLAMSKQFIRGLTAGAVKG